MASLIGNNLGTLIATSVFFMAVAYTATSISIVTLRKKHSNPQFHLPGGLIIPALGAVFSIYLITQCTPLQIGLGMLLLAIGVPVYIKYTPKKEIAQLKQTLLTQETCLKTAYDQEHLFLAHALRHIKKLYRKAKQKNQE